MEKRMHVLHINCNYMTTSLHQEMIEHLDAYTNNTVFCPVIKGCRPVITPNPNVISVECFTALDRLFYLKKQNQIIDALEKNIKVAGYDIIHAYTLFTDGNCAMRLSNKYGIPYVVAVRNTDINVFFRLKPYLIPRGIQIMERAERVFFLSESYRRLMIENFVPENRRQIIESKAMIMPNGINDFWLDHLYTERDIQNTQKNIEEKKINIVTVGQIIKLKNIPLIQAAIGDLRKKGWEIHLDVIGKKVSESEYKKIVSDPNTTYYAPVPKEKLIAFYRKNDIFVLVSHTETFGLVYAEAMSQGLPVIYTKGQGFDGQFVEGTVGYRAASDDPKDVADGIKRILDHYSDIQKNVVDASKKFSWTKLSEKYDQIYKKIRV